MSIYQEAFETKKAQIEALETSEVRLPNIPVEIVVSEAEALAGEALKDKEALSGAGLDWTIVDDLIPFAHALRHAEAVWIEDFRSRQEAQDQWIKESPSGYSLRDELLHDFTYAYRDDEPLKNKIKLVRDGSGHQNMVQDLYELYIIGERNPEPLQAINFNMTKLNLAATKSEQLSEMLRLSNGAKDFVNQKKMTRDKTFTLLMDRMNKVRECGRYVFWRTAGRKEKYASEYKRG